MTTPEKDRQGIQADKPVPPWEQAGCFRLDCKPHRGALLCGAAAACVVLLPLSILFGFAALSGLSRSLEPLLLALPALVGLPPSLGVWLAVQRDLALMRKGLMDPGGLHLAVEALHTVLIALGICLLFVAFTLLRLCPL